MLTGFICLSRYTCYQRWDLLRTVSEYFNFTYGDLSIGREMEIRSKSRDAWTKHKVDSTEVVHLRPPNAVVKRPCIYRTSKPPNL